MAKETVKLPKTFIVQKTFEFIVSAIDREGAISEASVMEITEGDLVSIKCGTPKQMKRDDVR